MNEAQTAKPRVALVTGAARGNGLAIAKMLAQSGASVVCVDIAANLPGVPYDLSSAAQLEEAVAQITAINGQVLSQVCDVRDSTQVNSLLDRVNQAWGGVDILVNNAGLLILNPLSKASEQEWDLQMDTMAKGAFNLCRGVLPLMNDRGWGRIINIASVAGHRGLGTGVAYSAAKHAVIGLTRALAMEVARQNITVNAICPGTADTPLIQGTLQALGLEGEAGLNSLLSRHLSGRAVETQDVAHAVAFLASDAAARINGTSLFVDDGWHAH